MAAIFNYANKADVMSVPVATGLFCKCVTHPTTMPSFTGVAPFATFSGFVTSFHQATKEKGERDRYSVDSETAQN